ncbi:MAG: HAD-IIIA family hydrolase [Clostridium sp.]|uniref:D-glycero-alpha-D-manno-heptose-1,7-bisphosphate 7-phosphatase n=1 Tax=Clostridium sp. TaxID=1506 RepID=UPI00302E627B
MKKSVVFLDFQGTLGGEGIDDIRSFKFYPFSIEAIKLLNTNNILVIGITNQSHISKGELTMEEFESKLQCLKEELESYNAHFDAVYCCPHVRTDKCNCKKPLIGMIDKAKDEFEINMQKAYVVGDMGMTDMALARNINAKGILVLTGVGKGSLNEFRDTWKCVEADYIAENVLDSVMWIINDLDLVK